MLNFLLHYHLYIYIYIYIYIYKLILKTFSINCTIILIYHIYTNLILKYCYENKFKCSYNLLFFL